MEFGNYMPQGTVLGSLLFLIFINDLAEHTSSTVHLFADDCVGWKEIAVSKLMYGCGALAWYQSEYDLDMGRWLWTDCRHLRNELIRGETSWSTFKERDRQKQ